MLHLAVKIPRATILRRNSILFKDALHGSAQLHSVSFSQGFLYFTLIRLHAMHNLET
jgi:hypothetical protein